MVFMLNKIQSVVSVPSLILQKMQTPRNYFCNNTDKSINFLQKIIS